ncbi:MAG: hypothetical protein GY861_19255 [bacterium]|nr:hypothetical protein [bacterium]
MLLLITGSDNRTSDKIVRRLGKDVFRLNYDLWSDYSISINPDGWKIQNPSGFVISSKTVSRVLYWKAFDYPVSCDKLTSSEVKYIFREIYEWCVSRGMLRGTPFYFHQKIGKINILSIAKKYFSIPKTTVSIGLKDTFDADHVVVKSLASEVTDDFKGLMTTEVPMADLDPEYPWFIQEKINSYWDVTVFICGDCLFSFRLNRSGMKGVDWRAEQGRGDFGYKKWDCFILESEIKQKILSLSEELNVTWGRYDFMMNDHEELVFLEFNANGQWGFLDPLDEYGLLDQVVKYLQ